MITLHHILDLVRPSRKPVADVPQWTAERLWNWLLLYGYRTLEEATVGPRARLLTPQVRHLVDVHHMALRRLAGGEQPEVGA